MRQKLSKVFFLFFVYVTIVANDATLAQNSFDGWRNDFRKKALANGISAQIFNRAFLNLQLNNRVNQLAKKQPEFTRPIWIYVNKATSGKSLSRGRAMKEKWRHTLQKIEQRYGVNKNILLSIWGRETNYGSYMGNTSIISTLASISFGNKERKNFGDTQLLAALKILQSDKMQPAHMTGSWAGAMGHTQFIPTTYNEYAVDFDGDGKRDIWRSVPDALASTANYLKHEGWQAGKNWGYEVKLPMNFDYSLMGRDQQYSIDFWRKLNVQRVRERVFPDLTEQAFLYLPAGRQGPAFLMLKNYLVIKQYNFSDSYALAVAHLADRIGGAKKFSQSWPRNHKPLRVSEVKAIQKRLQKMGYYNDKIDGRLGPKTVAAIRDFQKKNGDIPDGFADARFLKNIK